MEKFDLSIVNILILISLAILKVIVLSKYFKNELEYVYYENNYISIDIWFLIHIINNIIILYIFDISYELFLFLVLGWEVLENIILPNLFKSLNYFKETQKNINGDILAAIPAILLKYYDYI